MSSYYKPLAFILMAILMIGIYIGQSRFGESEIVQRINISATSPAKVNLRVFLGAIAFMLMQARWLETSPYPSCADHAGVAHRNFGCEFTRSSRSRGRNYTCAHPLDANCIAGELILFSGY